MDSEPDAALVGDACLYCGTGEELIIADPPGLPCVSLCKRHARSLFATMLREVGLDHG